MCVYLHTPMVSEFRWRPQCVTVSSLSAHPFSHASIIHVNIWFACSKGCEMLRVANSHIPIAELHSQSSTYPSLRPQPRAMQESHVAVAHCHLHSPKPPRVGGCSSSSAGADNGSLSSAMYVCIFVCRYYI